MIHVIHTAIRWSELSGAATVSPSSAFTAYLTIKNHKNIYSMTTICLYGLLIKLEWFMFFEVARMLLSLSLQSRYIHNSLRKEVAE